MSILEKISFCSHKPLWILVPDVVGDAEETFKRWGEWYPIVKEYGMVAFAAQDGMGKLDVPTTADCVFVGGTTEWKLTHAHLFKGATPILHIGRVNTLGRLRWAKSIGADSVDGTGFFRGDKTQLQAMIDFIEGSDQYAFESMGIPGHRNRCG